MGIRLMAGPLTLDQLVEVRILHPQQDSRLPKRYNTLLTAKVGHCKLDGKSHAS